MRNFKKAAIYFCECKRNQQSIPERETLFNIISD